MLYIHKSFESRDKGKRPGKLTKGVILFTVTIVYNARVAATAMASCSFGEIVHTPYSPDITPSDYFLYSNLKKDLRHSYFDSDESLSHR